jgi:CubicO group peptidase (beta-lactamase class C family)/D-alanyl-D-alanine dipeptidase
MNWRTQPVIWLAISMLQPIALPVLGQETAPLAWETSASSLETFISAEMKAKSVSGVSILVVDGQKVVWSKGLGFADKDKQVEATADTRYPLGSISKLITALVAVQLSREGKIKLDTNLSASLTAFQPENPFASPITLRHLLAHCSGLNREPPVGSFLTESNATRGAVVESLNKTVLLFEPGKNYKYSNAAYAVAGALIEQVEGKSFDAVASDRVFHPLGMKSSSFRIDANQADYAVGEGWTSYGKTYPIQPTSYSALDSAGGLVSSVNDMGKLVISMFDSLSSDRPFLESDLQQAFTPQFPGIQAERSYGLGFTLRDFNGTKLVGHGGAINGCVSELAILPREKLGVIVCATKESANMFTRRIAEAALGQLLALKLGKSLPKLKMTDPLPKGKPSVLCGRYRSITEMIEVYKSDDRAWLLSHSGGPIREIKSLEGELVIDDAISYGELINLNGDAIMFNGVTYTKEIVPKPKPCLSTLRGLLGEYGSEKNPTFILEMNEGLFVLIESFFLYPLSRVAEDEYQLPHSGLYSGELVKFVRDHKGKGVKVFIGTMELERRSIDGEEGSTFKIIPSRSVEEIRLEALAATPPVENGEFLKPDLVDLSKVDPTFRFDIRYATSNNFMGAAMYSSAKAFLQRPAAEALVRVNARVAGKGFGILVFDCYRPWYVTKMFWDATPQTQRGFVADPAKGSRHNRGCAADVTLYELSTGKAVEMVSGFDEFSDRAYPNYPGGTSLQRWHRQILRDAMEAEGFTVYENEWWHFDYKDWRKYPILNSQFENIR